MNINKNNLLLLTILSSTFCYPKISNNNIQREGHF